MATRSKPKKPAPRKVPEPTAADVADAWQDVLRTVEKAHAGVIAIRDALDARRYDEDFSYALVLDASSEHLVDTEDTLRGKVQALRERA